MMSDDSDVEILDSNGAVDPSLSGNDDICQLCPTNLRGKSAAERQHHYDSKHQTRPDTRQRAAKRISAQLISVATSSMKCKRNVEIATPEDVFWYPAQHRTPPGNYTPGILSTLKAALKRSHTKGATQRAVLCYERTPHIYHESFDLAWGCGYRNFLMTCAALMDQQLQTLYFPYLDDPLPPSVRNLQHWLEDAWECGYDSNGASHYKCQIVDTKKKIGTGEIYVAFTSRKIPCTLVDFDLRKSPKGFGVLTEWVVNYFSEKPEGDVNKILRTASPVVATGKMPIIMQYDGHSMTIVGYELAKNGKYNLLVFDPSRKPDEAIRQADLISASVGLASSLQLSPGKSKRRDRSRSPAAKKRSRTDLDPAGAVAGKPDSDDEKDADDACQAANPKSTMDPEAVIKVFRLKKLRNKHNFQLLYFTMGDPLSDEEQKNRRIVYSVLGC